VIALRHALRAVSLPPLLLATAAVHASPLIAVNDALQPCLAGGKPQPCPAALRAIDQLQASPAFAKADILCKQQVQQFKQVVALMTIRDTTPIEAQASLDGVGQVCSTAGF